jgi:hypothetical protein
MSTSPGASDRVPGCGSLRNFLKALAVLLLKVLRDICRFARISPSGSNSKIGQLYQILHF